MPWDGIKAEFGRCGERTEKPLSARSALSFFLSLSFSFTPSRFRGQGSDAPAVAAGLGAGAGVWTKTKAGAIRGAEPAAPQRRQWTPVTGPLFLHPFLPSFLHSVILALLRVYFLLLSFLRTHVPYTGVYIYVKEQND